MITSVVFRGILVLVIKGNSALWMLIAREVLRVGVLVLVILRAPPLFLVSLFILAIGSIVLLITGVGFIRSMGKDCSLL